MADELDQRTPDPTNLMTLDQRINNPNPDARETDSIDINKQVEPGHDAVVNHLSGDQELGTGAEAKAVADAEAAGKGHTPVADVQPLEDGDPEHPRSPDPEVNGPAVEAPAVPALDPAEPGGDDKEPAGSEEVTDEPEEAVETTPENPAETDGEPVPEIPSEPEAPEEPSEDKKK